jgi:hypothetical protein
MHELARRLDFGQPARDADGSPVCPQRRAEGGADVDMLEGEPQRLARSAMAIAPITSRSVWRLAMIE